MVRLPWTTSATCSLASSHFQNGAVDADGLAETCAAWAAEPTQPLADLMVDRGLMTDEQKTQVEEAVRRSSWRRTGATRTRRWRRRSTAGRWRPSAGSRGPASCRRRGPVPPQPAAGQGGHVVLGSLSPGEHEARERYTLTHLHAKGGMGRVWLARDGALGRQIAPEGAAPRPVR